MMIVEMKVRLDCSGCKRKIRKALVNLDGVNGINIDVGKQTVTVSGSADWNKVLKTVRKTGRKAELILSYPYININYNQNQSHPNTYHRPSSSCNYPVYHGCITNSHDLVYYSDTIIDERTSTIFSNENPNACSIM